MRLCAFVAAEGVLNMDMPQLNQAKMEEFGGRAVDILNKASLALMMNTGHRTGLFEAMTGIPDPLEPFLYATSCMHCMTVSLSQNGQGLGAMWGREKAEEMLAAAGLEVTRVYRTEEDPVNCWYVATKV